MQVKTAFMKLNNSQLTLFINRIKLKRGNMPEYRTQVNHLLEGLQKHITNDQSTGVRVTRVIIAGAWKKGTILRPTGENPIDIDIVLYIEGDKDLQEDLERLHDLVIEYLEKIYPTKDIDRDVDAGGKTKSIKIKFAGSKLVVDIVPAVPLDNPKEYVWLPRRGGGGDKYVTSVTGQLDFADKRRGSNPYYTSVVRALKWWRNYKELEELSSFTIELIVSHLELTKGPEKGIEEGIIRFFEFVSGSTFPIIQFSGAINSTPVPTPVPFVADVTNNANNAARKIMEDHWKDIRKEANQAFETLNIAQSKNFEGDTIEEWKSVFGSSFNINEED